jgi:acetoacetyl-CoA synthetase
VNIDATSTAIFTAWEGGHKTTSWQELRDRVRRCSVALQKLGVRPNDRVAGFLGNHDHTVVALLATASIGAVWTGVSPDTGVTAVLDRLVQIEPVVLFSDTDVKYNGKVHECLSKTKEIATGLDSLTALIIFDSFSSKIYDLEDFDVRAGKAWRYSDFLETYWYVVHLFIEACGISQTLLHNLHLFYNFPFKSLCRRKLVIFEPCLYIYQNLG